MNYGKLISALTKEMKQKKTYNRLNSVLALILKIIMIPMMIGFIFNKISFHIGIILYKAISAPCDALQMWLKKEKDGIYHATQTVLYIICMPTIFSLQVTLSFYSVMFFCQWLGLMINAYILSLGGIKWQPIVTDAVYDEEEENIPEFEYED